MNVENYMKAVQKEYKFSGKLIDVFEKAELAFLATLDWSFKEARKKDKGVDAVLSKKEPLQILDVGCGSMMYAWPMKVFFENFGAKRKIGLCGIDDDSTSVYSARNLIRIHKIEGIHVEYMHLHDLEHKGFDVISCFNFNSSSSRDSYEEDKHRQRAFFKKISELLKNDGILVLSFHFGISEYERYEQFIKEHFEVLAKEHNPFSNYMSRFIFTHEAVCIAKKKKVNAG